MYLQSVFVSVCGCVCVPACLFWLKSRHLSSWAWASLLPRNAQIVCTHFSSSFSSSHYREYYVVSDPRYLAILNFRALLLPIYQMRMRISIERCVKLCLRPSQGELEQEISPRKRRQRERKESSTSMPVVHVIVAPIPIFFLQLTPSVAAFLCSFAFHSPPSAFVKWRAQQKLLVMRRAVRKFAWPNSWAN